MVDACGGDQVGSSSVRFLFIVGANRPLQITLPVRPSVRQIVIIGDKYECWLELFSDKECPSVDE